MYAYFSENGTLKELVNDLALRQYSDSENDIYLYLEGGREPVGITLFIKVNDDDGTTLTRVLDLESATETNVEVPYSSERILNYFKVGETYTMYKYTLTGEDLAYSGSISIEPWFYFESGNLTLGKILAVVSESNIEPTRQTTYAEYLNLMETLNRFKSEIKSETMPLYKAESLTMTIAETYSTFGSTFYLQMANSELRYRVAIEKASIFYFVNVSMLTENAIYIAQEITADTEFLVNGQLNSFINQDFITKYVGRIPEPPDEKYDYYLTSVGGVITWTKVE